MARNKELASGKRFGSRYGRRNRDKVAALEHTSRKAYPCPKCSYTRVKRQAAGIWLCGKCGNKFASRAYAVGKPVVLKARVEEI